FAPSGSGTWRKTIKMSPKKGYVAIVGYLLVVGLNFCRVTSAFKLPSGTTWKRFSFYQPSFFERSPLRPVVSIRGTSITRIRASENDDKNIEQHVDKVLRYDYIYYII
ncbi:unnamed protein product, partial [Heterosigma akashiwo]